MRGVLVALAAISVYACGSSSLVAAQPSQKAPASAQSPVVAPTPVRTVTNVSGTIGATTVWSGVINVVSSTVINPGVTVTVRPGTTINITAQPTLYINVRGTLIINGNALAKVVVRPTVAGGHWLRFLLPAGGRLIAHYLVENGGGFRLYGGALTLMDSSVSRASGDLIEGTGSVDVEYSSIGLERGNADTTHCDMHFNPGSNSLKVVHSNVSTAVYGLMFYGGTGADFQYDNWFADSVDVETLTAYPVNGDFSYSWFAQTPPRGRGITANSLASTRLPSSDTGPRA